MTEPSPSPSQIRSYDRQRDFDRVARMLVDTYAVDPPPNWLRMRWEYMHYHPYILTMDTAKIGVVDVDGEVAAVVHFEHDHGAIYLQVRPGHEHLKPDLIAYAQRTFFGHSRRRPGWRVLGFYVSDFDVELAAIVADRGFERMPAEMAETMSRIDLSRLPATPPPEGFRLQSLADKNDLRKVNRVLWRGFNHEGPPPEEEVEGRAFVQGAPHFRKDLTIVAVAPDGNYAAYGGLWVEHANDCAYVEPVATDPDYRRLGLGTAVVIESLRRAAAEGVHVAWVGSSKPFYQAMGFEEVHQIPFWAHYFQ